MTRLPDTSKQCVYVCVCVYENGEEEVSLPLLCFMCEELYVRSVCVVLFVLQLVLSFGVTCVMLHVLIVEGKEVCVCVC